MKRLTLLWPVFFTVFAVASIACSSATEQAGDPNLVPLTDEEAAQCKAGLDSAIASSPTAQTSPDDGPGLGTMSTGIPVYSGCYGSAFSCGVAGLVCKGSRLHWSCYRFVGPGGCFGGYSGSCDYR